MLLKETDLFDAITVIIDLISANNLINVDIEDIKEVSYSSKDIGFYSFEIERKGEAISTDNVTTHLLSKSCEKIKETKGIVALITSGINLTFDEFCIITESISPLISDNCITRIGLKIENGLSNIIRISMIAAY